MKKYIYFILLLIIFCLSFFTFAESASQVTRFSPNEGLAQSSVRSLLVDNQGYLWIATEGGLNRYDGYTLSNVSDPDGLLRDEPIEFIYEDTQGDIWISTLVSGLFHYQLESSTFTRVLDFKTDYTHSPITMLEAHHKGYYWLGRVGDLALLNAATGEVKSVVDIPSKYDQIGIRKLKYYKHYLLIATSEGLFVLDTRTRKLVDVTFLNEPLIHHDQENTKSFHLMGDMLWLGTVQGLHKIDLTNIDRLVAGELEKLPSEVIIPDLNIWKIQPYKSRLKLATDQGVFDFYYQDDQLVKNTEIDNSKYTLSDNSVVDMLLSDDGSMWLATKVDGAFFVAKNNYLFQNYNRDTLSGGLSHNNVWQVVEHNKKVWLATDDGLTKVDLLSYKSQTFLEGYLAERGFYQFKIIRMYAYKDKLWLTTNRGLFTFDLTSLQIARIETNNSEHNALLTKQPIVGYMNTSGDMYFQSFEKGYYKYNVDSHELEKFNFELGNVSGENPGYFVTPLSGQTLPAFYHKKSLYQLQPDNSLKLIYQIPVGDEVEYIDLLSHVTDDNGVLWLSFRGYGLVGIDSQTFQLAFRIDDKLNLKGSLFYDLTKDATGAIWMTSHKGLWRFNPDTLHFRQYTVEDGIAVNEFNDRSGLTYSDGRLIFGSIRGITSFFPERNNTQKAITSRVNITSIKLASRQLEAKNIIDSNFLELEHDDIGLEIGFSAMLFKHQDRVVYEYRLDNSSLSKTDNNKVTFARISPGKHTFYVRARDPLTGEYTEFKSFTIQVTYPPWRSPAAFLIYLLVVSSLISVWQIRRLRFERKLLAAHKQSCENETRFKMALESSQSGVWEWRSGEGSVYQPRLLEELGYESSKVSLDEFLAKLHPEDRAKYRIEWLEFVSTDKGHFELNYRLRHSLGHWRWYKDVGRVIEWHDGLPQRVAGTYTNFTRERNLESSARLFGAAFEHTRDWVFVMDGEFNILAINKALRESYQFNLQQDSSRKLSLGLAPKRRAYYLRVLSQLAPGKHFQAEETISSPDGSQYVCLIKVTAVANELGEVDNYIVVMTDISSQKEVEQELHVLSNYDRLTGLPNRSLFIDRVQHAISLTEDSNKQLAVLFIDLDKFKKINDSFGHSEGDQLLLEIATRITSTVKNSDTTARINGDEFVILLEDAQNSDEVGHICERLIEAITQPMLLGEQKITISPSIGVGLYDEDGTTSSELLKAADIAMYHAKKQGGARFLFFREEMNFKVQRLLKLESSLKHAQLNNELINHYQPIFDSRNNQVVGFETLMRWRHKGEFISPSRFIQIAESTGLITSMTLALLERAIVDVATWQLYLPNCYVSVNLSAKDFQYDDLAERIISLCNTHNLPCHLLALEITESILMADSESAKCAMDKLKQAGCKIYLDDFGTGYSSLTYLKRFPVDMLKIDHSFVSNIGIDHDDEAIIHSTLALAHSLGKECIAEGVEKAAQIEFLEMLGCSYMQGFYYSEPLAKQQVLEFLKARS